MFRKMSRTLPVSFAVVLLLSLSRVLVQGSAIEVHFSPQEDCEAVIVHAIEHAEKSIRVQACYFTSVPIADALVKASKRPGVVVEVIVDNKSPKERGGVSSLVHDSGIPTFVDATPHKAHSKIIVIDGETDGATVITGSFNFTREAKRNAENLVLIRDPNIVAKYEENWESHWKQRKEYPTPTPKAGKKAQGAEKRPAPMH